MQPLMRSAAARKVTTSMHSVLRRETNLLITAKIKALPGKGTCAWVKEGKDGGTEDGDEADGGARHVRHHRPRPEPRHVPQGGPGQVHVAVPDSLRSQSKSRPVELTDWRLQ